MRRIGEHLFFAALYAAGGVFVVVSVVVGALLGSALGDFLHAVLL